MLYRDFAYFVLISTKDLAPHDIEIFLLLCSRSTSDRSGKDCCGQWFNGPPLRFLVVLVALGGVACKFYISTFHLHIAELYNSKVPLVEQL